MTPFELYIKDVHVAAMDPQGVAQHVMMHVRIIQKGIEEQCPDRKHVEWSVIREHQHVDASGFSVRAEVE